MNLEIGHIYYFVHIQEFLNILIANNVIWFEFFGGVGCFLFCLFYFLRTA